jgi:hypothetical protein
MRGRDEGTVPARARKHDVPRLVADESVRTTRGGLADTSTMLTLSERWFTTHTSPLVRAATATGSRPTATEPVWSGSAGADGEDLESIHRAC